MAPISSVVNHIWDCFHINSVEEGPDNTLLISMRDMWAIYLIDKVTGDIIWQLGGKQSDFTFDPNATFSWQHDARFRPGNRISLFDNACCATSDTPPAGPARGLILTLNYKNMSVAAEQTYRSEERRVGKERRSRRRAYQHKQRAHKLHDVDALDVRVFSRDVQRV